MNKDWFILLLAAIMEVGWVIGLAHAYDAFTWFITLILIIISNYLLIQVAKVLPPVTVYTVFVGLGTAGSVLAGIFFFQEDWSWLKLALIAGLLTGVVGLQVITERELKRKIKKSSPQIEGRTY